MGSMVVSCVSGRGINELRNIIFDVASQVRENTGTCSDLDGRGIGCGHGCGHISEHFHLYEHFHVYDSFQWLGVALGVVVFQSIDC